MERFEKVPEKLVSHNTPIPHIIAVGGGKGGIGKTVISACLSMAMAEVGKEVVLVDGDLGGSNLNNVMGIYMPTKTMYDFLTRKVVKLAELTIATPFPRLKMICGAPGSLGIANIKHWEKRKLMRHFRQLEADFAVIDVGAGMSYNEIDLFNVADTGIVIANPEPPAIQECYNFIKVSLFRKLRTLFSNDRAVLELLDRRANGAYSNETRPVSELTSEIVAKDAEMGSQFQTIVEAYRPHLLLNDVYDEKEKAEGLALKYAANDLLGIDVEFMGMIPHSTKIREAIQQLHPADLYENNLFIRRRVLEIVKAYFL